MALEDPPGVLRRKLAAWTACAELPPLDAAEWRQDAFGNTIRRSDYGKQTQYGWEIDHAHPTALGGADNLFNLRALHWRKNRELGAHVGNAINIFAQHSDPQRAPRPRGIFGFGRR